MAYCLTNCVRKLSLDCTESDRVTGCVTVATKEGDFSVHLTLYAKHGVSADLVGHFVTLRPLGGHVHDKDDWTPILSAGDGTVIEIRLAPDVYVEWLDARIGGVVIEMESVAVQA